MKKILSLLLLTSVAVMSYADDFAASCSYMQCASWQVSATAVADDSDSDQPVAAQDQNQATDNVDTNTAANQPKVLNVSVAPSDKANQIIYESNDDPRIYFIVEKPTNKISKSHKKVGGVEALKASLKNKLSNVQFASIQWQTDHDIQLALNQNTLPGDYTVTTANFDDLNTSGYQVVMDLLIG